MSLMNEALRKKNRETTGSPAATGFIDVSQRPRISRHWLIGLAATTLLTAAVFCGTHLIQTSAGPSLLVKSPQPGRARPPAHRLTITTPDIQHRSEPTPSPALADHQTETATSEAPPTEDRMVAVGLEPSPPAAPIPFLPDTRDGRPASDLPPAEAQPPLPHVTTASGSNKAPMQSTSREPSAASRRFEPGPGGNADAGEKTGSGVLQASPSPARPALSPAPGASNAIGKGKPESAIRKRTPSDETDDLFYKKARAYHRGKRLDDAIRLYQRVLNTNASHPGAMLNLAAAYMQQGNFIAATPLLKRLEQANPRPQGVLLNQAIAAIGMGAYEKALADLDRAAAQSDASPWEIRFHRAVVFARMNRLPDALVLYREAARERPDDPRLRFNMAVTCDALGLYAEALSHYGAVLRAPLPPSETDKASIITRTRTIERYLNSAPIAEKGR